MYMAFYFYLFRSIYMDEYTAICIMAYNTYVGHKHKGGVLGQRPRDRVSKPVALPTLTTGI